MPTEYKKGLRWFIKRKKGVCHEPLYGKLVGSP